MYYTIRVAERLDGHWAAWFDRLILARDADGTTTLTGPVSDQAELHGQLTRLRDLGLTLLSVQALPRLTASRHEETLDSMAMHESHVQMGALGELRYQPTAKRITVLDSDGSVVARTDWAALVKEPRRVVDEYAVPRADIRATVTPTPSDAAPRTAPWFDPEGAVYPPGGFRWHTTAGTELDVAGRVAAGFALDDADLDGYVLLDFGAFEWLEEDEPVIGHPRSPYHRVDVRQSDRHIVIERDGVRLAESSRPRLAFETGLPVRYYLPVDDVDMSRLTPSDTHTICAYKGVASYWTVQLDGATVPDLVWGYPEPFADAAALAGLVCFYDEKVDVTVDSEKLERPVTDWS